MSGRPSQGPLGGACKGVSVWAGVVADPPWGVAPLPCSPPFPARSLAIATMRRGDGERQGREGGGRGGGKGEKGVAAPCDGGRRGTGAGRVRGGCGYWRGSRQAGAAGQIPPSGSGPAGPCRAGRAKELSAGRARGWVMGCGGSCTTPPRGEGGAADLGLHLASPARAGRRHATASGGRAGDCARGRTSRFVLGQRRAGARTRAPRASSHCYHSCHWHYPCHSHASRPRGPRASSWRSRRRRGQEGGLQRLPAQDAPPPPAAARAAPPASRHRAARAAGGPRAGAIHPDGAGSVVMRDSTAAPSLELPSVSMRRRAMRRRATEGRGP